MPYLSKSVNCFHLLRLCFLKIYAQNLGTNLCGKMGLRGWPASVQKWGSGGAACPTALGRAQLCSCAREGGGTQ